MQNPTRIQKAKIAWLVLFHRKTPFGAKAIIGGAVLYGILPFDIVPDFLPVIGLMDDATIFVVAIVLFLHLTKAIREEMGRNALRV
jgi:uncharacterized membrane protein YkvA (DUF1232 family)